MKYPWWKTLKCSTCKRKISKSEETADLRLDTLDGIVELVVCLQCAEFFEKSAEVLVKKDRNDDKPGTEQEDFEED